MNTILQSNETKYRLIRTIIQGIVGVLLANVDFLFSGLDFTPEAKAFIVALTMAILSPIMAELGLENQPLQTTFNGDGLTEMVEEYDETEDYTAEE